MLGLGVPRVVMTVTGLGCIAVLAAGALIFWDYQEESALLRSLEQDEDWSLQETAARSLARRESLRAIPGLLRLKDAPAPAPVPAKGQSAVDPHWRTNALSAICEARPLASFRVLVGCLKHADPGIRLQAVRQIYGSGPWILEAVPALQAALEDREALVYAGVARALWQAGEGPDDCLFLEADWFTDELTPEELQSLAINAAQELGLRSPHGWTAPSAPQSIDENLLPRLLAAFSSDNKGKLECASAVAEFLGPGIRPLLPQLMALLADPRRQTREHAARAIAVLGPSGQEAAPALIPLLSAREREVRLAAWHALRKLWGARDVFHRARKLIAAGG